MNREQMIKEAVRASMDYTCGDDCVDACTHLHDEMAAVVDAILPQVTTVEELEALPVNSVVLTGSRVPYRHLRDHPIRFPWYGPGFGYASHASLLADGPLTVVYTP